jgi:hypothetical protein
MLLPANFDPTKPLSAARFFEAYDLTFQPGDDVPAAALGADRGEKELDFETALRLWLVGYLVYKKDATPTPAETAAEAAERLVKMEDVGGGWWLITTPWGNEGEKVQGKDAAEARRQEIVVKGDTKGVVVTAGGGGWYSITAPWLDDPVRVQGKAAAAVEESMLIEDGPPAGWVPETADAKAARIQAATDAKAALAQQEADEAARVKAEADAVAARDQAEKDAQAAAERAAAEEAQAAADKAAGEQAARDAAANAPPPVTEAPATTVTGAEDGESQPPVPPVDTNGSTAGSSEPEPKELAEVTQEAASVLVMVGDTDWTVTAPWLDAPETFDTAEKAEARQQELRAAGAPDGWVPKEA